MKLLILVAILTGVMAAPSSERMRLLQDAQPAPPADERWREDILQTFDHITSQVEWHAFKKAFAKTYDTEEEKYRKEMFKENLRKIQLHNFQYAVGLKSFTQKINEFSDMSDEEFWDTVSCLQLNTTSGNSGCSSYLRLNLAQQLPDAVDWRQQGYVTGVKNQGQCGSCWAFSSTGALEGQYCKKENRLVSMSEQNLVDCSREFGNHGCKGGLMDNAFAYVKANGGIDSEASYPYEGKEGPCRYTMSGMVTSVTGCVAVTSGDEDALKEAVATVGPVSVAIDASHSSFRHYSGQGVYSEDSCSSYNLDHGVLVVGYGRQDGTDYWLVKNSWGTSWGDNGYILMSRNSDNQCGIASHARYPLL